MKILILLCFTNRIQIKRLSTIIGQNNETEISFERLSVVLLTHVLQKTNANEFHSPNDCITSYGNYVSYLSQAINLDTHFNESQLFRAIDPFLRDKLQYYITNNTDQYLRSRNGGN
ncbi:unnamed protein product [Oppiella nova]|uniref:Uncharacterized protein n=1 Tax=Oppiella nova TaxID=334625 RepID=A0A7R9LSU5_9ACAR|nr:unnamed protein product [Oppiella nova]CAG2166623.1 unnamed protein product [Oppiella nova]